MCERSTTRQSWRQTSRFFSKGVSTRRSASSTAASARRHARNAARSCASICSGLCSSVHAGRLGMRSLRSASHPSVDRMWGLQALSLLRGCQPTLFPVLRPPSVCPELCSIYTAVLGCRPSMDSMAGPMHPAQDCNHSRAVFDWNFTWGSCILCQILS